MMNKVINADCRDAMRSLIAEGVRVQCVVTSPPYWGLRDYGCDGQLGLERTYPEFIANMVEVFDLVRQLLADDGTLWLNMGDSYSGSSASGGKASSTLVGTPNALRDGCGTRTKTLSNGLKPKDLVGIPWRLAFALQDAGWWLRQDIIWSKPNPMPESVRDRCTKAHEYVFLLSKSERYYYDADAIAEPFADERQGNPGGGGHYAREAFAYAGPNAQSGLQKGEWNADGSKSGRNRRSVWTVATQPFKDAHFATFPPALIEPCILAGSRPGDIIFDPFMGSGTVAAVAQRLGRRWLGSELNPAYIRLIEDRTRGTLGLEFA